MSEHRRNDATEQAQAVRARLLAEACNTFVRPLLVELYKVLDRRLVVTCLALLEALVVHGQRHHGLLLSELGASRLARTRSGWHQTPESVAACTHLERRVGAALPVAAGGRDSPALTAFF